MGNSNKPARHKLNRRDMSFIKPKGYEDYFTMTEVCRHLKRDARWLRRLEAADRIPRAHRVEWGKLSVRLWSPSQVEEIAEVLSRNRRGRPRRA